MSAVSSSLSASSASYVVAAAMPRTSSSDVFATIRSSTTFVLQSQSIKSDKDKPQVSIDHEAIVKEITANPQHYSTSKLPPSWAADYHYADGTDLTAQYVFVLDAINFCFWPLEGYEYSDLAGSLKRELTANPKAFDSSSLSELSESTLEKWLQPTETGSFWKSNHPIAVERRANPNAPIPIVPIPLLTARTRAVREVGMGLSRFYNGSAAQMIRAASNDASRLVELITATFPVFRDSCVYKGRQIFLYKRAQILVGDLWGAFNGEGLGSFFNVNELTCFADYRVPQLLRALGIMKYSPELEAIIDAKQELLPSETEIELRAATIQAVEQMVVVLQSRSIPLMPFQLDWLLWERGEASLDILKPHHRTLTVFY